MSKGNKGFQTLVPSNGYAFNFSPLLPISVIILGFIFDVDHGHNFIRYNYANSIQNMQLYHAALPSFVLSQCSDHVNNA